MVIYIHIKFHQIPLLSYLVMALGQHDGWMYGQRDGHGENYIPPPLVGDKNMVMHQYTIHEYLLPHKMGNG